MAGLEVINGFRLRKIDAVDHNDDESYELGEPRRGRIPCFG
jgi:hypothetical protein